MLEESGLTCAVLNEYYKLMCVELIMVVVSRHQAQFGHPSKEKKFVRGYPQRVV